jgi:hypothetical protein
MQTPPPGSRPFTRMSGVPAYPEYSQLDQAQPVDQLAPAPPEPPALLPGWGQAPPEFYGFRPPDGIWLPHYQDPEMLLRQLDPSQPPPPMPEPPAQNPPSGP